MNPWERTPLACFFPPAKEEAMSNRGDNWFRRLLGWIRRQPTGESKSAPLPSSEEKRQGEPLVEGEPTVIAMPDSHTVPTIPSPPPSSARPQQPAVIGEWKTGQIILGDYEVEQPLGKGGMGLVYLLRSRSTKERFAVKRVKFLKPENRRLFMEELITWIDLPEHPHLTACRFFRTVENEVLIFAEYVDGGSLAAWIQNGRLTTLEQILDVAIQFAWGLHAIHQLDLVHQDVKPLNVLMTSDRVAKVTDFGLARARAMAEVGGDAPDGSSTLPEGGASAQSILVTHMGHLTPAYCSPEQAKGERLSHRTDIWSWGVSVLEMFMGGATWEQRGDEIAEVLRGYLNTTPTDGRLPRMPASVAEVLDRCFRLDPAKRWGNVAEVAEVLKQIYKQEERREYPRPAPGVPSRVDRVVHDRRTTTGVQWTDPQQWLVRAFEAAGRDPSEAGALLLARVGSRKAQAIADLAAYDEARRIFEGLIREGREDLETELATLCIEKAFVHVNAGDLPGAMESYDRAIEIRERLVKQGREELANELARAYMNKATAVSDLGENRQAIGWDDRAIEIRERLVKQGREELRGDLAWVQASRAGTLLSLGDRKRAGSEGREAIAILEAEVARTGRADLQAALNSARQALNRVL
jgi:serine/threonine protein kinase